MFLKCRLQKIDIDTSDIPINEPYQGIDLSNESFDFEMLRQMLGKHFISQDIVTKDAKAFNYTTSRLYMV